MPGILLLAQAALHSLQKVMSALASWAVKFFRLHHQGSTAAGLVSQSPHQALENLLDMPQAVPTSPALQLVPRSVWTLLLAKTSTLPLEAIAACTMVQFRFLLMETLDRGHIINNLVLNVLR
jgi:hypothetical protein